MTDQLEMLFADLRTEALAEVRPPGTAAVRRTVRRRRIATSGAAGVAVLVVAGLVVGLPRGGGREVEPARSPAPDSVLAEWGRSAAEAVGLDPAAPGLGSVLTDTGRRPMTATEQVIGGDYNATVACVGTGTVAVTFEDSYAAPSTLEVPCVEQQRTTITTLVSVEGPQDTVTARFVPDAEATGRSSVAYRLELSEATREVMKAATTTALVDESPAGQMVASWSDVLDSAVRNSDESLAPGRYRARAACVGAGTVVFAVTVITDKAADQPRPLASRTVSCTARPSTTSLPFTVPATGVGAVQVAMTPEAAALGQVAAAVRVDRA